MGTPRHRTVRCKFCQSVFPGREAAAAAQGTNRAGKGQAKGRKEAKEAVRSTPPSPAKGPQRQQRDQSQFAQFQQFTQRQQFMGLQQQQPGRPPWGAKPPGLQLDSLPGKGSDSANKWAQSGAQGGAAPTLAREPPPLELSRTRSVQTPRPQQPAGSQVQSMQPARWAPAPPRPGCCRAQRVSAVPQLGPPGQSSRDSRSTRGLADG